MTAPQMITHDSETIRVDAKLHELRAMGLVPAWLSPLPGRKLAHWRRDGLSFVLHRLDGYFGPDALRVLIRGDRADLAALVAADLLRRVGKEY